MTPSGHPDARAFAADRLLKGERMALAVALAAALSVGVQPAAADPLPSGQMVELIESILEAQPNGDTWLRLRYLAPAIAPGPGAVGFDTAADDMLALCRRDGLAMLQESSAAIALIVVSLADRRLAFGTSDPDAVQYFEAFRPENDDCIWEEF